MFLRSWKLWLFPELKFHLSKNKNANWVDTENKDRESNEGMKTDRCNQPAKLALVPPQNTSFKETKKERRGLWGLCYS